MRCDVYVVGMRVEKCIGTEAVTEGPDFYFNCETQECNDERFILFCSAKLPYIHKKFTITLYTSHGWCGSGYTTASWGYMKVKEVDNFGPFTHMLKDGKRVMLENTYYDTETQNMCFEKKTRDYESNDEYEEDEYYDADVHNNVFSYSEDGGDKYYPSGYSSVNMELFSECKRSFTDRPVWIFTGESATGKSTLAYYLREGKIVLETDSFENSTLPETIWADIIVIGNKYNVTVQEIAKRLPKGTEIVTVNFMKGYLND